ncbi:hypothetical protein N9544_04885 [Flavobacteriales bacterium]|nr:hypothetical protein [Flavobacteriales bacterium]
MIKQILYIICFFLLFQCKGEEKKIAFEEYYKLDIGIKTDKLYSPKKKATIPFHYNQIYDPFRHNDSINIKKSVFEKGKYNKLRVIVLDTVQTTINVTKRKKRIEIVSGIPVIIRNKAIKNTNHLLTHRGGAIIIQEAKNKKGKWVEIENLTKEKIGNFYYKIKPKEYIYTKVPLYKGTFETTFRIKLKLDNKKYIYSNEYKGMIQNWMIR